MIYLAMGILAVVFALIMHHASEMLAVSIMSVAEELRAVREIETDAAPHKRLTLVKPEECK